MYAPAYIYFALTSNPTAFVEISTPSPEKLLNDYAEPIKELRSSFGNRFLIRPTPPNISANILPNTIRFIDTAVTDSEYLYIGDIDIMICESILEIHTNLISTHNLPFSNIIRNPEAPETSKRLTGLHFIETKKYYPLPDLEDLDLARDNDEHVLYEIMKRKGIMVPPDFRKRPELGLHMSLSRDPFGRTSGPKQSLYQSPAIGWGGKAYFQSFLKIYQSEGFERISRNLDIGLKVLFLCAEALIKEKHDELSSYCLGYAVDRSKLAGSTPRTLKESLTSNSLEDFVAFPLRREWDRTK